MKRVPLVMGSMAYMMSLGVIFVMKKGTDLTIECDGEKIYDGKLMLVAIANGRFCGGGVKGIPQAILDDGLMEVSIVKSATRREFIDLFNKYKKGEHLDDERALEHFIIKEAKRVVVTPRSGKMKLCTDGEITMEGELVFEIVPKAIRFSVPKR